MAATVSMDMLGIHVVNVSKLAVLIAAKKDWIAMHVSIEVIVSKC